jgi:DNA-binding IclR family transcriptional regulator
MDIEEKSTPRRQGIQSLEIGLKVLDTMVSLGEPSPLSVIAQEADLSASQAHRYLTSLINAGMAEQDRSSGRYRVGPAAIRLGLATLARTDPFAIADSLIGGFSRETGATIQIAALGPMGPTIVRWFAGCPPLATSLTVGSILPLLGSTTGHVFLAFTPAEEISLLVEAESRMRPDRPLVDLEALRERVRSDGYARLSGVFVPGLRATSIPIRDIQGRAALVATILTAEADSGALDLEIYKGLSALCSTISQSIGFPGDF